MLKRVLREVGFGGGGGRGGVGGGGGGGEWIDLADNRERWRALVNAVMNLRVPQHAGNFLSSVGRFSFSGRNLLHVVS